MAVDEIGLEGPDAPEENFASVVHVNRGDELAAVCGRVDAAPTWAVVIHAPDGNRQLSTELGMRRLLHHAADAGKTVAIATRSGSLASRARELRVPVARKPHQLRWDAGGRNVVRLWRFSLAAPSIGRYVQVGVIAAVAFVGLFLLFAMAPAAKITAFPSTETVSEVVSVTASESRTALSLETMEVPASRVTGEQTFTLALRTTGTASVGVLPARGIVTISNSTQAGVAVAAGSILFGGADRQRFHLDEAGTVPPAGSIEVPVTAERPGIGGNLAPGSINAFEPTRLQFLKVTNAAATTGGTNEPRPAVDPKDVASLQELARALEGSDTVRAKFSESHPRDAIFLGTAESKVEYGTVRPAVGTPATLALLDVTVKLSALAVLESTLDELARAVLSSKGAAGEFIPGSIRASETGARQIDAESGLIRTELLLQAELARGLTTDDIRTAVRGKSESGAKAALADCFGIEDAEVKLSSWSPRLPRFGFRIDVGLAARETPLAAAGLPSPNGTVASQSATTISTPAPGPGSR